MPTTILNANPSNFRALVQKFTGRCSNTDISVRRKGPVTLDFRSPASVSKEVIFPSSGDTQNYDSAIDRHVGDGESHVTMEWDQGKETVLYQMGQLSECMHRANGHYDNHDDHDDDDDLVREYFENSSFNGMGYMDYDDFYHDAQLLEDFMMRDLDISDYAWNM
ncbi:uncharacterized protein LOC18016106 [Eutrema salsugineum]|nr:uncharacterized protein LOC18016106 [Eutrema salsugineum]